VISIVATIRVAEEKADEAAEVLRAVARAVQGEPGTLAYTVGRSQADPAVFTVFELYGDEDALAAHRAARAYTEVQLPLRSLLDGTPDVVVADVVAAAR
jgi:quinol monooxygenase YgiN